MSRPQKLCQIQVNFKTKEEFKKAIFEIHKHLNLEIFGKILDEIFLSNEEIPCSKSGFGGWILKTLNLQGNITSKLFWISRGWDETRLKEWQSNASKRSSHIGQNTLQHHINKHGEQKGTELYRTSNERRGKNLKHETLQEKYGKEYIDQLNFLKGGSREKYIAVHGKEIGTIKFKSAKDKEFSTKLTKSGPIDGLWRGFRPYIGRNEKLILDALEISENCKIDRNFRCWKYFPDGYCHETNTIFEIFEKHHLREKTKSLDVKRFKFLKDKLNCEIRVICDMPIPIDELREQLSELYPLLSLSKF